MNVSFKNTLEPQGNQNSPFCLLLLFIIGCCVATAVVRLYMRALNYKCMRDEMRRRKDAKEMHVQFSHRSDAEATQLPKIKSNKQIGGKWPPSAGIRD